MNQRQREAPKGTSSPARCSNGASWSRGLRCFRNKGRWVEGRRGTCSTPGQQTQLSALKNQQMGMPAARAEQLTNKQTTEVLSILYDPQLSPRSPTPKMHTVEAQGPIRITKKTKVGQENTPLPARLCQRHLQDDIQTAQAGLSWLQPHTLHCF